MFLSVNISEPWDQPSINFPEELALGYDSLILWSRLPQTMALFGTLQMVSRIDEPIFVECTVCLRLTKHDESEDTEFEDVVEQS